MINLNEQRKALDEAVQYLKREITTLRTGRATPALVEQVSIEAYGTTMPLQHLATVTTPDARTIIIQPWDTNMLKEIEKGITAADLNLNPVVETSQIRLVLPPLTEENRRTLVKVLHEMAEACRVQIRRQREKIRDHIGRGQTEGTISEDQKFKLQKQLDEIIRQLNDDIKKLVDQKEIEIMTL